MSVEVDVPEAPNWLQQLEQQRERRVQRKLGHEAGAGAACLNCNDKCPGLDLHFWRKICKVCKCSKESHDIPDSDIYGWVQFELLGNKSNRTKRKIVLPGKKDALELEWSPKGENDTIEQYLKTLPPEEIPVKGSQAAQNRKQLLQKQIPVHDIDPTLCHELTPAELNQMNEYISHVKENSVGVGQIINLSNILKGNLYNIDAIEAALVANRYGKGLSAAEIVKLQASGMAKNLEKLKLTNLQPQNLKTVDDEALSVNKNQIKDINYAIYAGEDKRKPLQGQYTGSPLKNEEREIFRSSHPLDQRMNITNYNPQDGYNVFENSQNPQNITFAQGLDPRNHPQNVHNVGLINPFDQRTNIKNYNPEVGYNSLEDAQEPRKINFAQELDPRNHPQIAENVSSIRELPETGFHAVEDLKNPSLLQNPNYIENYQGSNLVKKENFGAGSNFTNLPKNPHYVPGSYHLEQDIQNPTQHRFKDIYGNANEPIYQNVEALQQSLGMLNNNTEHLNEANSQFGRNKKLSELHPAELHRNESLVQPQQIPIGAIHDINYEFNENETRPELPQFAPPAKSLEDVLASIVLPNCHHCNQPFRQEEFAIPLDRSDAMYHANCFKCYGCNQLLADNVYFYDKSSDQIYCGRDYAKIRGIPRCSACDELIFTKDYCLAQDNTYHVKHFCCFDCETPLAGQNYVLEDNQTFCLPCFEQNKADQCNTCKKVIKPGQEGATLKGLHFHVTDNCFACYMCNVPLVGKKLLLKNDKLYCSSDCYNQDNSV